MPANSNTLSSHQPIGHVLESSPQLKAVLPGGETHLLSKGDPFYFGETLVNGSVGNTVILKLNDGTELKLFGSTQIVLDESRLITELSEQPPQDGAAVTTPSASDNNADIVDEAAKKNTGSDAQTAKASTVDIIQELEKLPNPAAGPAQLHASADHMVSAASFGANHSRSDGGHKTVVVEMKSSPAANYAVGDSFSIFSSQPDSHGYRLSNITGEIDPIETSTRGANLLIPFHDDTPSTGPSNPNVGTDSSPYDYYGSIDFDYGANGAGSLTLSLHNFPQLTSGGEALQYSLSADGRTLTATVHGEQTIFTLYLSESKHVSAPSDGVSRSSSPSASSSSDGSYHFHLEGPLDFPANGADLPLNFTYLVTDKDGDTTAGNFTVLVDDVPSAGSVSFLTPVYEGGGTGYGTITPDYGNDGAGSVHLSLDNLPVVSSGGEAVQYSLSEDGLTLTGFIQDGTETANVFILELATQTVAGSNESEVQINISIPGYLDHPASGDLPLNFTYLVTDGDGDTAAGNLTINATDFYSYYASSATLTATNLYDDMPTITVEEGVGSNSGSTMPGYEYSGNITVDYGTDGPSDPNQNANLSALTFTGIAIDHDELVFDYESTSPDPETGSYQFGVLHGYAIEANGDGTQIDLYTPDDGAADGYADHVLVLSMILNGDDQYVIEQNYTMPQAEIGITVEATDYDGDTASAVIAYTPAQLPTNDIPIYYDV